jgi:hypothetical protein
MRNIDDVLREKEAEMQRLQREVEALRLVATLLMEGEARLAEAVSAPVVVLDRSVPAASFETASRASVFRQFP